MVNRTQALVPGFLLLAWTSLLVILVAAPQVYDQALRLPTGNRRTAELGFLAALTSVLALLAVGLVRRWRWTFWLILVAFLFVRRAARASGHLAPHRGAGGRWEDVSSSVELWWRPK